MKNKLKKLIFFHMSNDRLSFFAQGIITSSFFIRFGGKQTIFPQS